MTPAEWAVVVGGIAAIAWINWYFFLAERGSGGGGGGRERDEPAAGVASEVERAAG
ncbi:MAG TPA: hypothetical protein VF158_12645 [Longimicrobiales bacterium]